VHCAPTIIMRKSQGLDGRPSQAKAKKAEHRNKITGKDQGRPAVGKDVKSGKRLDSGGWPDAVIGNNGGRRRC
jgi:hypothetical protein